MSVAHQLIAVVAIAVTVGLVAAAAWSWAAARRSAGRGNHRFLVDRLLLGVLFATGTASLVGLVIVAGGHRPTDGLHLLYGVLAVAAAPLGWAIGGRSAVRRRASRQRRDAWIALSAVVLLAVELRLVMTG